MAEKPDLTAEEQHKLKKLLEVLDNSYDSKEEQRLIEGKAKQCVSTDDIQRIIDLGLGRGIDATNPTPWQNKTSFQVRPVTFENIIGTEEGGCVQSYEREITSVSEVNGLATASITDPNAAVNIGVEGEYSLSSSNRLRVVGIKVLNCNISFKDHCVDNDILDSDSFETWLYKWILRSDSTDTVDHDKQMIMQLRLAEYKKRDNAC